MATTTPLIMFADDDDDDRMLFEAALKKENPGVRLLLAAGGLEAMQMLRGSLGNLPDVLFLDINMPGFGGWECLQQIKSDETLKNLRVIMYSTSNHPADIEKAYMLGAYCFCTKPDTYPGLISFLTGVVKRIHENRLDSLKEEPNCHSV